MHFPREFFNRVYKTVFVLHAKAQFSILNLTFDFESMLAANFCTVQWCWLLTIALDKNEYEFNFIVLLASKLYHIREYI